jgi:hypothetical protein
MIELLIASSVMLLVAGSLGMLAMTVQSCAEYGHGHGMATQHARVCLERIERTLSEANCSEQFPGFAAFGEDVGGWMFPDTLVVWRPEGAAVDPDGLPRFNELVIFCPDPSQPSRLLEITMPGDSGVAYAASDTASWETALASIKADNSAERVELTDLLRTADPGDGTSRGAVRFYVTLRPTEQELSDNAASLIAWDDINWVQDIHGPNFGLRQAWCRFELQMTPEGIPGKEASDELAIPFFGSAAVYSEIEK